MDLLERDVALRVLDAALGDAARGEGRVVLVSGEAGIGKTALLQHFAREHDRAARVYWGACDALFTPRPLGPLLDLAAQLPGAVRALLGAERDRAALFSAVLAELQGGPSIVVFEDVHWADEATLDLLRFLGRRVARTRALLVLSYRDDELGPRHPLRTLLGDLAASPAARRVPVTALSEPAVRALVADRAIDAAALHRQTGGNPFFVTEVLAGSGAGLPPTVRDAVLARAARLSAAGQRVAQAASVIGRRVEPWLLGRVAGADAPAVEDCLAGGMLVGQGELLAFRHELTRQAVLESVSPPRLVALHRATLDALVESAPARADPARLAHHAVGAGDRAAVLVHAPSAARRASAATAHRSAAGLYALALRVADDLPPDDHAALLEAYARECTWSDSRAAAIASRRQAADLRRAAGDALGQGENLAHLALALVGSDEWAEAEQVSQRAVALLEALPPGRELALAYRMQALLRKFDHEIADAIDLAERAVELAERFGDARLRGMVYDTLGTAWLFRDYERGRRYLEVCVAIAREAGLEGRTASAYGSLGSVSCALHRFDEAERYLAEGIAFTTERDLDIVRTYMLGWQAVVHLHRGRWKGAEATAEDVARRPDVSEHNRVAALVALGRLRARRGDAEAAAVLDEALALANRSGHFQHVGPVRAARAEAAWVAGDGARVLAETGAVYDLALGKQHAWIAGELAFWRWRAGDERAPPEWVAEPFARQIEGDWRAAADAWARLGCPYEHARALADGDDHARVAALDIFGQLGARPAAQRLRGAMRASGATRIPRGPRPATRENPFGLTTRQMDILALLADRLSNAEIAARLVIAPKTAEHHVAAVLAKLEVSSREAAVAVARGQRLIGET